MESKLKLRLLSIALITYMVLALGWWSLLLFRKNEDVYRARREVLELKMPDLSEEALMKTSAFLDMEKQYKRQKAMILQEGLVLIIILLVVFWFINRAYLREMAAVRQQRNFLLAVTHELKSPIASLQLTMETILKRPLTEEQKKTFCEQGISEADRLNTLVNQLLLSAKLDMSFEPYKQDLDLAALIEEWVVKLQKRHANVEIDLNLNPCPFVISADKAGITAIIVNLLENAVKYSSGKALVSIALEKEADNAVLTVSDSGIGISDDEKGKVFQKFYRVGNEDTRQTKGTGLGLYIVKKMVMAHDGSITILDNDPKGTIFKIVLPIIKINS